MEPEIRIMPDQRIVYVERRGFVDGSQFNKAATEGFTALMAYSAQNDLNSRIRAVIGAMPDDMMTVAKADQRYIACFAVADDKPLPSADGITEGTLPGGKYAVFLHKGPWSTLGETWMEGWNDWFPNSGMAFRVGGWPLEIYLNDSDDVAPEDLRTEVCLPVE